MAAADEDARAGKFEELQDLAKEKYDEVQRMQDIQLKYARANGFRVE